MPIFRIFSSIRLPNQNAQTGNQEIKMPSGGFRPGAGRPKGSGKKKQVREDKIAAEMPADVRRAAEITGETPLEYALRVMRNPEADQVRRDRMCAIAMPFCHAKPGEVGKKDLAQQAAERAGSSGRFAPRPTPTLVVSNETA
jgi:phage terminase small subunit